MAQTHHDHSHGRGNERRVFWAAVLTGGFMLAEVVGGVVAGSLALLADAAHMLTDAVSLTLAWFAFRLGRRPADRRRTYGFHRFQILVAFANGIALLFLTLWIFYEAAHRLLEPVEVLGGTMLAIAVLGLLVNVAAFLVLHGAERKNLNIRGATLHVLGDLLGSAAALLAALVILATNWTPIDPLLSVLVGLLILRSAWRLVKEAGHILLEGAPADLDVRDIGRDLATSVAEIEDVHHVHAWSLTQEHRLVTLHARLAGGGHPDRAVARIKERLKERFGIGHATVEIEHGGCADEPASRPEDRPGGR